MIRLFLICILLFGNNLDAQENNLVNFQKKIEEDAHLQKFLKELQTSIEQKDVEAVSRLFRLKKYELYIMGHELYNLRNGKCKDEYFFWHEKLSGWWGSSFSTSKKTEKLRKKLRNQSDIPWMVMSDMVKGNLKEEFKVQSEFESNGNYNFDIIKFGNTFCNGLVREKIRIQLVKENNQYRAYIDNSFLEWKGVGRKQILNSDF